MRSRGFREGSTPGARSLVPTARAVGGFAQCNPDRWPWSLRPSLLSSGAIAAPDSVKLLRMKPFPEAAPYESGMLDVEDGQRLYWEISGNPAGKPAVVLHGGPGSGSSPSFRRMFDPALYKVVQFDQRNCGRSTPHASEPGIDLSKNTTAHLIDDCERIRSRLGIERWLVWGGSWGTTLGLAYAQAHPERVSGMVLVSVVATTRREVEWVTRSMGRIFPEEWARFREEVPEEARDGDLAAAYHKLLHAADPRTCERAAKAWCEWEETHVATAPGHRHDPRYDDPRFRLCFARIVTHYWSNAAFLDDEQIIRDAHRLRGIPGVLIGGRLDISSPPDTAWRLARQWPDAEVVMVDDAGHGASHPTTLEAILAATDRFARRS
jgi:proline iminopeptidase